MKLAKKFIMLLKGFLIVNGLWYLISILANNKIIPSPITVYISLLNGSSLVLYKHVFASTYRVTMGLSISLVFGILIGVLMAKSSRLKNILGLLVYFTYPIPKTVLLPVLMLLLGLGDSSKILLIVLIVIFQVIVTVRDAVTNISSESYDMIASLGASKLQIYFNITLPAIIPELLTSLRLSVGTALSILFFAEAYGTKLGIGYYILDAWSRIDYISMYKGIVIISIMGLFIFVSVDLLEDFVCKWKQGSKVF